MLHLRRAWSRIGKERLVRLISPRALALLAFGACLTLVLWSRLGSLDLSFWNDEAFSAVKYIDRGPAAIFDGDYLPNNHVLFSWLAWHATEAFGRSEPVYRLCSVLPGIAALLVLWIFAARRVGTAPALLFALLSSASPVHLELVRQARGYGLAFLAAALLVVGAVRASERPRDPTGWLLVASAGWIGIATLPIFALPFAGQLAALLVRPGRRWRAALVGVAVSIGCVLFYGALLPQIFAARTQEFGTQLELRTLLTSPFPHLLLPEWSAPWATTAVTALGVMLAALGAFRLYRRNELDLLLHLVAPIVTTYVGLWLLALHIVPRFVSYLLLNLLLLLALGAVEAGERMTRSIGPGIVGVATAVSSTVVLVLFVRLARETHALPLEAYKDAAAVLHTLDASRAFTNSVASAGFDYYIPQLIEYPPAAQLPDEVCRNPEPVIFIDNAMWENGADLHCLRERHATRFAIPQRVGGKGGGMTIWLIDPVAQGLETPAVRSRVDRLGPDESRRQQHP